MFLEPLTTAEFLSSEYDPRHALHGVELGAASVCTRKIRINTRGSREARALGPAIAYTRMHVRHEAAVDQRVRAERL
jgi:hypothetical protein